MRDLQENIVPATNQNRTNYFHEAGKGLRVLFVGNSITRHGPREDIGWDGDWGMAASSLENDYLHILVEKIRALDSEMAWSIAQVAPFEWDFQNMDPAESYPEDAESNEWIREIRQGELRQSLRELSLSRSLSSFSLWQG